MVFSLIFMIAVWVLLVNKVRSAAAKSPKPLLFLVKLAGFEHFAW